MVREWNEGDHPRNPDSGEFVDKVGGGGWAQRLASMIGRGRTRTPAVYRMTEDLHPKYSRGNDPGGNPARQGGSPMLPDDVQNRREDVLHAFDPIGNYRRGLNKLYDDIGIPDPAKTEAIETYLGVLRPEDLPRPTGPGDYDYGLAQITHHIYDPTEAQEILDKLEAHRQRTGQYFPETTRMLEDIIYYTESED